MPGSTVSTLSPRQAELLGTFFALDFDLQAFAATTGLAPAELAEFLSTPAVQQAIRSLQDFTALTHRLHAAARRREAIDALTGAMAAATTVADKLRTAEAVLRATAHRAAPARTRTRVSVKRVEPDHERHAAARETAPPAAPALSPEPMNTPIPTTAARGTGVPCQPAAAATFAPGTTAAPVAAELSALASRLTSTLSPTGSSPTPNTPNSPHEAETLRRAANKGVPQHR